ncbi:MULTISPECIES: tail fiber domain-containing protein [Cysteiniphilum]|uniref:tail fiber domain-containing protein n=1 Tax=Cysteiniphilum TaxID=2056696 RepID=UPI00178153D2|nr:MULTISPECIES: tail fiber domain-containing protein [Cysteiniphilum]
MKTTNNSNLDFFISPFTGELASDNQLPELEDGAIWFGDFDNRPIQSFKLLDVKIDVEHLKNMHDLIKNQNLILTHSTPHHPNAQGLSDIEDGLLMHSGGTISRALAETDYISPAQTIDITGDVIGNDSIQNPINVTFANNPTLPGDVTVNGTGYLQLPVGSTAQRPSTPNWGMQRYNNETYSFEQWDGTGTWKVALTGLVGTANQISINTVFGVPDKLAIGLVDNPYFYGNESLKVPTGTTAQRPVSPVAGMQRFNTTLGVNEQYDGSQWLADTFGTVTSVTAGQGLTGGTITDTGTISIPNDPTMPGTGAITIPRGTTAERPAGSFAGMIRYNTDTAIVEIYNGTWKNITTPKLNEISAPTASVSFNNQNITDVGTANISNINVSGTSTFNDRITITSSSIYTSQTFGYLNPSGSTGTYTGNNNYGLYTTLRIAANEFHAFSSINKKKITGSINTFEKRLKKDFSRVNFVSYEYKDPSMDGHGAYIGYIAEELCEVFPHLVDNNVYDYAANVMCKSVVLNTLSIEKVVLKSKLTQFQVGDDLWVHTKHGFFTCIVDSVENDCAIVTSLNKEVIEQLEPYEEVFIYGKKVCTPTVAKTHFHDLVAARLQILINDVERLEREISNIKGSFLEKNNKKEECKEDDDE